MAVIVLDVVSTELFVGTADDPRQVVGVALTQSTSGVRGGPVDVTVSGPGVRAEPVRVVLGPQERERTVEVGVRLGPGARPGDVVPVTAAVQAGGERVERPGSLTVAEPGWTMFMVSHFHFDPVWWNTQSKYTEDWDEWRHPRLAFQGSAFDLMDWHIARALDDPDYTFVVAELDYLKPYWDARPEQRPSIRRLIADRRMEVMGGTYNEPSTNLSGPEATARNAVYGAGFQREVMGADPRSAWQLDVFGHDPQFPGMMADAGLTSTSWARGPFHQNGPTFDYLGEYPLFFSPAGAFRDPRTVRDPRRMEFPSEFEWLSPSGRGLLTSYMHNHYLCGWSIDSAETLPEAEEAAYEMFLLMKRSTATKNLLLPFGTDYASPSRWVTDIHRDWNRRYVWPRFVTGTPRDFFDAVRRDLAREGRVATPQTRDMNPVWTGKDVSLIDTKQAQRTIENLLVDAEKFATLAALSGRPYPEEAFDLAWRQVFFGAHHDSVTGTGSDQVYVDLLGSWREAYDIARAEHDSAAAALALDVDTRGEGVPVVAFNSLSWQRRDAVTAAVEVPWTGRGVRITADDGTDVPFVVDESAVADGTTRLSLTLVPPPVASLGHRTLRALPDAAPLPVWSRAEGTVAENEYYRVEVDPARGGAVSSLVHLATGKQLVRPGSVGNELLVYDEYPQHPNMGEGPWMLTPKGPGTGSAATPAEQVTLHTSPAGGRLTVRGTVDGVRFTQTLTLWRGVERVDCVTRVDEFDGADKLLRVRLPAAVAGGRPVAEVGDAVIGRAFGFPDEDSARSPWTLDTPANNWAAVGSTARAVAGADEARTAQALGVAEVVVAAPDDPSSGARELVVALAAAGVTATTSAAAGPRYGNLDVDSNLPDFRVGVGHPDDNAFVAEVLAASDAAYRRELDAQLAAHGNAVVWVPAERARARTFVPMADLRDARALPVLVVAGPGALDAVVADLADATVLLRQSPELAALEGLEDFTVGLLNRGTPGFVVDTAGTLHLSLMRSCSGWPSGMWIDPPRRTVPDGSPFHHQHWTHDFAYAIAAGPGDWRKAGLVAAGHEFNHPLHAVTTDPHPGAIGAADSLLSVEPARQVVLTALKPSGNPVAAPGDRDAGERGITVRLYEAEGRPADATVTLRGGFRDAVRTDLLEHRPEALPVRDGAIDVRLTPAQITTVGGHVARGAAPAALSASGRPGHARYWRHNRGAAPAGYVPVSVHTDPRPATVDGTRTVDVTIASDRTTAESKGQLTVAVPQGWDAEPAAHDYRLAPGAVESVPVAVTAPAGAEPGTYLVQVAIVDDAGHELYDTARLVVPGAPDRTEPELSAAATTDEVRVAPGGAGELRVTVRNSTPGPVAGELHLITPFAAWRTVPDPVVPVELAGGAEREFTVRILGAVPAGTYWLMPKLMWAGRVGYAPAVRVVVGP